MKYVTRYLPEGPSRPTYPSSPSPRDCRLDAGRSRIALIRGRLQLGDRGVVAGVEKVEVRLRVADLALNESSWAEGRLHFELVTTGLPPRYRNVSDPHSA